jgi:hypothetical protein
VAQSQQDAYRNATSVRIGQAIMLHRGGDREEARNRLARLWSESGARGDLFERCTIAHYMADTQDDPHSELEWDLRALAAADALTRAEVQWGEHLLAVRSLYPSLHLNLAVDHAELGDDGAARRALERARESASELADDDYGRGVKAAISRLETRLAAGGRAAPDDRLP